MRRRELDAEDWGGGSAKKLTGSGVNIFQIVGAIETAAVMVA